jgi:hypothetical protein
MRELFRLIFPAFHSGTRINLLNCVIGTVRTDLNGRTAFGS